MNHQDNVVHNDQLKMVKMGAILMLFTLILAPIGIWYLLYASKPTDVISGFITGKRSGTKSTTMGAGSSIGSHYYIIISAKQLEVSREIFKNLAVGDYISASYRKGTLYFYIKGNK